MKKLHIQQVKVDTRDGAELGIESVWNLVPFVTDDADLDACYEMKWWWKKLSEITGEAYDEQGEVRLEVILRVYQHFGWEHYNTAVTEAYTPREETHEDYPTAVFTLFFRKT